MSGDLHEDVYMTKALGKNKSQKRLSQQTKGEDQTSGQQDHPLKNSIQEDFDEMLQNAH